MVRTSSKVDARERARQARLKIDAERDRRDQEIEEAAARYFTAHDERSDLLLQLEAVEDRLRAMVGELLDLGESPARVAALLGIEAKGVRRLRSELEAQRRTEAVAGEVPDGEAPAGEDQVRPQAEFARGDIHSGTAPVSADAGA